MDKEAQDNSRHDMNTETVPVANEQWGEDALGKTRRPNEAGGGIVQISRRPAVEFIYDEEGYVRGAHLTRESFWEGFMTSFLCLLGAVLIALLSILFFDMDEGGRIGLRGRGGMEHEITEEILPRESVSKRKQEEMSERPYIYLGTLALMAESAGNGEVGAAAKLILGSAELSSLFVSLAEEERERGVPFPKVVTGAVLGALGFVGEQANGEDSLPTQETAHFTKRQEESVLNAPEEEKGAAALDNAMPEQEPLLHDADDAPERGDITKVNSVGSAGATFIFGLFLALVFGAILYQAGKSAAPSNSKRQEH